MQSSAITSERLRSSIHFVSRSFQKEIQKGKLPQDFPDSWPDLKSLYKKARTHGNDAELNSFIAYVFLLSNLQVSDLEFDKICKQGYLPDPILPLGLMYKVVFGNIRQFLHPDSDQASLRELRGRYMIASVFMEVATSYILEQLHVPKANRVFWGLGGSLFIIPSHFGPRLKSVISDFNRDFGIPEIGFELSLSDTRSEHKSEGNNLISPNEDPVLVPKNKLFGWQNFSGKSRRTEAEYVSNYALSMANSIFWRFRENPDYDSPQAQNLSSKLAGLPYWVLPAEGRESGKTFVRDSYLAELGTDCAFMDSTLELLARESESCPINYFRLDISGMRETLAVENEKGIKQLYLKCQQMDSFFRETIPAICKSINENPEIELEVALLHSTCDDVILVTRGANPEKLIDMLLLSCKESVNQKLVFGGVKLKPGLTACDLSHTAMVRLVSSKE